MLSEMKYTYMLCLICWSYWFVLNFFFLFLFKSFVYLFGSGDQLTRRRRVSIPAIRLTPFWTTCRDKGLLSTTHLSLCVNCCLCGLPILFCFLLLPASTEVLSFQPLGLLQLQISGLDYGTSIFPLFWQRETSMPRCLWVLVEYSYIALVYYFVFFSSSK